MKVFVLCLAVVGVLMGFSAALAEEPEEIAPGLSVTFDTSRASRSPQEFPFFSNYIKDLLRQWWVSEGQTVLRGDCLVRVRYNPGGPGIILDPAMVGAIFRIDQKASRGVFFIIAVDVDDSRGSLRRAAHILMDGARSGLKRWVEEREAELCRQELREGLREKLLQE